MFVTYGQDLNYAQFINERLKNAWRYFCDDLTFFTSEYDDEVSDLKKPFPDSFINILVEFETDYRDSTYKPFLAPTSVLSEEELTEWFKTVSEELRNILNDNFDLTTPSLNGEYFMRSVIRYAVEEYEDVYKELHKGKNKYDGLLFVKLPHYLKKKVYEEADLVMNRVGGNKKLTKIKVKKRRKALIERLENLSNYLCLDNELGSFLIVWNEDMIYLDSYSLDPTLEKEFFRDQL